MSRLMESGHDFLSDISQNTDKNLFHSACVSLLPLFANANTHIHTQTLGQTSTNLFPKTTNVTQGASVQHMALSVLRSGEMQTH